MHFAVSVRRQPVFGEFTPSIRRKLVLTFLAFFAIKAHYRSHDDALPQRQAEHSECAVRDHGYTGEGLKMLIHARYGRHTTKGFSLIELMIVVAIIAILAAIAIPAYSDYVLRGKLVDGLNGLTFVRTKMEQFYQDNRTYATTGSYTTPCADTNNQTWGTFTVQCSTTPTSTGYTLIAKGSGATEGFWYTIDQSSTKATTQTPSKWGSVTSDVCWIIRKTGACY